MDTTELILKFGWLGWKGDLSDIDSLNDWLFKNYKIEITELGPTSYSLSFEYCNLCNYYGVNGKDEIVKKILPDITLLWKCENGKLDGPRYENFEEPNIEWT